ncbi:patatin-like phospholipase domain-containing protein 2 [Scomber scombrus]|uniref:patatin-like phospholipase domain-containing protein 2 n=1 Tax=Scomber scombrus TaxID=13677 RepID=UPI002DDB50F8|nr:patatin-like phospholipase domain-containing protein 2 [Scomber scombrus]
MLDLSKEWSISFAGCGFMGIYYIGATSCILERFPSFIQNATKICGASSGSLMATVLTVGIPLEKCCQNLMFMAKEARKHKLGPLHPAYNLVKIVKDSLLESLPEDAHVRASGRLCISLTRVSDGQNVLVSEFDNKEELIEALVCSCFVPLYCGVIPPTYRGVHYVDGAVSDNLPSGLLNNTITFAAYAGESDVCPRGSTISLHEVRVKNVSIQVNTENMYRVANTFFPPPPEVMAEICQNGYLDALRFLQDNNLICSQCPQRSLEIAAAEPLCCELPKESAEAKESSGDTQVDGAKAAKDEQECLDPQLIGKLPLNIRRVLCESYRETRTTGGLLSQVTGRLRMPSALQMDSARSLAQRLAGWIPGVPKDMNWLYGVAGDIYKKARHVKEDDSESEEPQPLEPDMQDNKKEDGNALPLTPETTPTSGLPFTWNTNTESNHTELTPPPTPKLYPRLGEATVESDKQESGKDCGLDLSTAVGCMQIRASEQRSSTEKPEDAFSVLE